MPNIALTEPQIKFLVRVLQDTTLSKKESIIRDRVLKALEDDGASEVKPIFTKVAPPKVNKELPKLTTYQKRIMRRLIENKGRTTSYNLGATYPDIAPLVHHGLIKVDGSKGTPDYVITDFGKEWSNKESITNE